MKNSFYILSALLIVFAVGFPGAAAAQNQSTFTFCGIGGQGVTLGILLEQVFLCGMGFVGFAALIVLTYGGILYLTAGDSTEKTGRARKRMWDAVVGLSLALTSWLILYTINPDLVQRVKDDIIPQITLRQAEKQAEGQFVASPGFCTSLGGSVVNKYGAFGGNEGCRLPGGKYYTHEELCRNFGTAEQVSPDIPPTCKLDPEKIRNKDSILDALRRN